MGGLALRPHIDVAALTEGRLPPFSLSSSVATDDCAGLDDRAAPKPLNSGMAAAGDGWANWLVDGVVIVGSAGLFAGTAGLSTTADSVFAASCSGLCSEALISDPIEPGTLRD